MLRCSLCFYVLTVFNTSLTRSSKRYQPGSPIKQKKAPSIKTGAF